MAALKQEPAILPALAEPPGLAAVREALEVHAGKLPEPPAEPGKPKRKVSAGEILFDRVVYTGIGFGVNEASSLWITDQFVHGKPKWFLGGKPFSHEGFEAATKYIAKTFKMPHAKAGNTLLMATLLSGGTLLVLPMRALEENKIYWTKKANHLIDAIKGNKMSAADTIARDAEVEQAVACSPQQNWKSLLVGRFTAMFSSWATGTFLIGPDNNDKIMDFSEKHITTAAKALGAEKATKTGIFKRYSRLIGVETYSCFISSVVLEMASKLFAKSGTEIHDPEICKAVHGTKPAAPADTAQSDTGARAINPEQYRKKHIRADKGEAMSYADKAKSEKETSPRLAV